MKKNLSKWWPGTGQNEDLIKSDLKKCLNDNIDYANPAKYTIIGFPGTTPDPLAVYAYNMFMEKHANNICTHTNGEGEKGFDGSHALEKEVIFMLGQLLGSNSVNGYVSSGGTESNIMGLILAREHFNQLGLFNLSQAERSKKGLVVITSFFTHYSLRKGSWVLGDHEDDWLHCPQCTELLNKEVEVKKDIDHIYPIRIGQPGIHMVGTDKIGRVSAQQMENSIRANYAAGIRRFVLVSTEGNVMTGAMDNTREMGQLIARMREEFTDAGFYLHVDAAIGGFVWPFKDDTEDYGFYVPEVDSISIDVHKMGLAPYPSGIFIYRKDERNFISLLGVKMGYVPGEKDGTLVGSRPGASAAACYAVMKKLGFMGYAQMVQKCMDNTKYFYEQLSKIDDLEVIMGDINIVSWRFKDKNNYLIAEFIKDNYLVCHDYPDDFSDSNDHVRTLYKSTVMPHVTKKLIDKFMTGLKDQVQIMCQTS